MELGRPGCPVDRLPDSLRHERGACPLPAGDGANPKSFKGDLYQKYILKGQTPNFNTFLKLRDHWDEFVAYKIGQQGQAMMETNKENAAKKKYHHHLGSGGYSVAMPKCEEMEASLLEREKDELSLALQTPEHPRRTRGKGVIPWKIGFKEDIHTYRSRMRSKRDTEAKIEDLEYRVSSYELSMQEEVVRKVDERMAAHRSHDPQPTIPPAMMSPSGNRSSCASTGQVGSQSMDAIQTQDETTCLIDDITQRTPCEVHIPFKNLSIKVASGMAILTDPSKTYHCRPIPVGYSKVPAPSPPQAPAPTPPQAPTPTPPQAPRPAPSKSRAPQAPPPAPTKAMKKAKVDAAKNKDPGYDCTQEKLDAYVASEVRRQLKPRSPENKIPIDPSVKNFFRGAPIEKAEVKYMYELGKPLVKPEQLQSLPTQMYQFHQLYMEMSATSREMIGVRIRDTDFMQGEDILWINFKEWRFNGPDSGGVFDTGFVDPRKVNVAMLDQYPQATEDNLVHLLKAQHYKTFILLPYNTEAWYRFRHLVRCKWRERLRRKFNFHVIHMRDKLTHKEFIAAVQEQLMGFINE
uniref:OSJNBb0068N06.23 protein n=1 Tax=Oryza sativa subsp. japonica TaxID=39947 RepID=Q7F9Q7_ORYSJ|nr:OSJNBb0068N06.23 [Oryza sativa Japonica Group]